MHLMTVCTGSLVLGPTRYTAIGGNRCIRADILMSLTVPHHFYANLS